MYFYHYEVHSHDNHTGIDSIKDICILGNSFEVEAEDETESEMAVTDVEEQEEE
jgi:hypothetical protein